MERMDPLRNFNFVLEIDGIQQAGFTDCTGIGAVIAPIEYNEGGKIPLTRKLPGMAKYNDITLKWGLTVSRELWDWFYEATNGRIIRKKVSVVVYDLNGVAERVRWNFIDCWPTKWDGPDFAARNSEIAIDSLTLSVERVERA
jgi:phage tail-like protein